MSVRILIVDDEFHMREMLGRYLQSRGYEIEKAADGKEALLALSRHEPAIVLTDLNMPVMDGLTLIREIRKTKSRAQIIVLTGHGTLDTAVEAMQAGAFDFVTKPVEDLENDLLRKVLKALEHRGLVSENNRLVGELKNVNDALHARQVELEQELEMAGVVQESLLPPAEMNLPGLEIASCRVVAGSVSGQFFDAASLGPKESAILIGEVMGRDVPSALLMSMTLATIREIQKKKLEPERVLRSANTVIRRYLEKGFKNFVTAFYGLIDNQAKELHYVSAAHPAPLLVRKQGEREVRVQPLEATGNYLGKYEDAKLATAKVKLHQDDLLFFYTENLLSISNKSDDSFGLPRLHKFLMEYASVSPKRLIEKLKETLRTFDRNELIRIDVSFMAVKVGNLKVQ